MGYETVRSYPIDSANLDFAMSITRRALIVLASAALLSSCVSYDPKGVTTPDGLSVGAITRAINEVRQLHGAAPVRYSTSLAGAARTQANLMASKDKLSHNLGPTLRERVRAAGFEGAVGENVAGGHPTLEAAIQGWLDSPAHKNTLLTDKFTEFGLAVARVPGGKKNSRYGIYWALVMGGNFEAWKR